MIRLCFLIRQLNAGGAERQLLGLIRAMDKSQCAITLVTYYAGGSIAEEAEQIAGIQRVSLNKKGRWDILPFLGRLLKTLHTLRPHVLHSYLSTSNLMAVFVKPFLPHTKIVWGVRASFVDLSRYDQLATIVFRLECFCSRFADLIIVNSKAGREYWVEKGFPAAKVEVIPNGIDTNMFSPSSLARQQMRVEWNIGENQILIGLVGRLDPMKDHANFLMAASRLSQDRADVRFVCVGDGPNDYREELMAQAEQLGLNERLIWAGPRSDMPTVQNALDIAVSSSIGEGFPNVIGEAMACGVPCVVTDVGDSAWIVGETGIVVSPGDPEALAGGWRRCLAMDRTSTGPAARNRIIENFGVQRLAERTEQLLCKVEPV